MGTVSERQYAHFLERATAVHGDKYTYGNLDDRDEKGRVKIVCPDHGEFLQYRGNHISGSGCKPCALESRTTTVAEFVKRSQESHGIDTYDYSQVIRFKSTRDKVAIICSIHGQFSQIARDHMRGVGCSQCAIERSRITFSDFLTRAKMTHGDRYSYLEESWGIDPQFVKIVCSIHGLFTQNWYNHTIGMGCVPCSEEGRRVTLEEFSEKARSIHGNRYSYPETSWRDTVQVEILCPDHGSFLQYRHNHLNGQGCPRCFGTTSKAERDLGALLSAHLPELIIEYSCRSVISPYELDIYIPDLKLAIEFNGVYWHSKEEWARDIVEGSRLSREALKSQRCEDAGVRLLHVWEDDWIRDSEGWLKSILDLCESDTAIGKGISSLHACAVSNLKEAAEIYARRDLLRGI